MNDHDKYNCLTCPEHSAVAVSLASLSEGIARIEKILERIVVVEERSKYNDLENTEIQKQVMLLFEKTSKLEVRIESLYLILGILTSVITLVTPIYFGFFR